MPSAVDSSVACSSATTCSRSSSARAPALRSTGHHRVVARHRAPPSCSARMLRVTCTVLPSGRAQRGVGLQRPAQAPARSLVPEGHVLGRGDQRLGLQAEQAAAGQAQQLARAGVVGDDAAAARIDDPGGVGQAVDQRAPGPQQRLVRRRPATHASAGHALTTSLFRRHADARRFEEVGHARARRQVVQRRGRQLRRLQAAPDAQVGRGHQVQVQRLVARHLRVVHQHVGLERARGVDAHHQRVAVVGELHHRAGRVHAHHADEGVQHAGVELASAPARTAATAPRAASARWPATAGCTGCRSG